MDRKQVEEALGPVWDWYQSDEHPDRTLEEILKDMSADLQKDRRVVLEARRIVDHHRSFMERDVREEDKMQHEFNSLRALFVGLKLTLR